MQKSRNEKKVIFTIKLNLRPKNYSHFVDFSEACGLHFHLHEDILT